MSGRSTISHKSLPTVLTMIGKLKEALEHIEKYAFQDFGIVKTVLEQYKIRKNQYSAEKELHEKFSLIISDLQYIDTLHQRLAHIMTIKDRLLDELKVFPGNFGSYALTYWFIVKLGELQFRDTIDHYVKTTRNIQQALQEIEEQYNEVFHDLGETGSFYGYNTKILKKAALVCDVYFDTLLKHRHPGEGDPLSKECIKVMTEISQLYTMHSERKILSHFMKKEMGYDNGYDQDTGKEMISMF